MSRLAFSADDRGRGDAVPLSARRTQFSFTLASPAWYRPSLGDHFVKGGKSVQTQDPREKSALSRRDFVGKLAVGAAVASAVTAVTAGGAAALSVHQASEAAHGTPNGEPVGSEASLAPVAQPVAEAPWELLSPLALGATVAHGWTVAGLSGAVDGSCVLTLQNARGRSHRVHICRNGGQPQGLVYTDHFDLLVMNGGQGDLPTEEGLAQAVAEVAHVLAANQSAAAPVVNALMPHAERVDRYAAVGKLR
jgi:hypothetical protein